MKHINIHLLCGKRSKRLATMALTMTMGTTAIQAQLSDTASSTAKADSTKSMSDEVDKAKELLRQCFTTLQANRATYNQYNDSLFAITDRDEWVGFFKRRAAKNHQIYLENRQAISMLDQYLDHTNGYKPDAVYRTLSNEMGAYLNSSDPFISMHMLHHLEDYYTSGECPDSTNILLPVYRTMSYFYKQISNMGGDDNYLVKAYQYQKAILDADPARYTQANFCKMHAIRDMCTFALIGKNAETIDEAKEYHHKLVEMLNDNNIAYDNAFINETDVKEVRYIAESFNERLVRNYYTNDTTVLDNATAKAIMRTTVNRHKSNSSIDYRTKLRCLLFQIELGDMTAEEALDIALDVYEPVRHSIMASKQLTPDQLKAFLMPFFTFFYINDIAEVPYTAKRSTVKMMLKDIVVAYSKLTDQQKDTDYVKYLNILATYERVNKYLKPKERVRYLNEMIVATQVTTYAHSVHVGTIAQMVMKSLLEHEPKLLIGMLGCHTEKEVRKKRKDFMKFIHEAALYHDLGKNQMIPIVTNDYRPLFDEEFDIIKRHPEYGLKYLELSPDLARYHDTTLGHHKWYNGNGGYPDSFDNTKSPYRTLIDIITLSDCMQAATEQVGRNYRSEKTFDMVMEEFRQQAGTRFNPDLVRFIDEHSDLADALSENLNNTWFDIYHDIYNKYINNK